MPLSGELSTYPSGSFHYPYFTSGDLTSTKCIAFIGGLTAGMGSVPYTPKLSEALGQAGWKLVQSHWSNAYHGYTQGTLADDARDMENLAIHLASQGITDLVFMGNSTGCQDIAELFSTRPALHPSIKAGILQAPVSDRESLEHDTEVGQSFQSSPEAARRLVDGAEAAKRAIEEGRGGEIDMEVWRAIGQRFTYDRFYSLYGKGGQDDYFSSDLPSAPEAGSSHVHPLSTSFGRFTLPTLALWSEKDQFAWSGLDTPEERMQRWADACPREAPMKWAVVRGADHEVTNEAAQEVMIDEVLGWLRGLGL